MLLSATQKQTLLKLARQAIVAKLKGGNLPSWAEEITEKFQDKNFGAFVTLKKNTYLRGCIGLLESPLTIDQTIIKMAVAAATQDPRFPCLTLEELEGVKIEISVLSPLQVISDIEEIILGTHGVLIKSGDTSGVFLPQVAQETGWDLEKFLYELCVNKAGLPPKAWENPQTELHIFTAEIFHE